MSGPNTFKFRLLIEPSCHDFSHCSLRFELTTPWCKTPKRFRKAEHVESLRKRLFVTPEPETSEAPTREYIKYKCFVRVLLPLMGVRSVLWKLNQGVDFNFIKAKKFFYNQNVVFRGALTVCICVLCVHTIKAKAQHIFLCLGQRQEKQEELRALRRMSLRCLENRTVSYRRG